MEPIAQNALSEALDNMWTKFLPQMEERVAVLEAAEAALAAGKLTPSQRVEATSAAHKLAGVLGAFGLAKGTILAREAEILYGNEPETGPVSAARLPQIAVQLRNLLESRKQNRGRRFT